MRIFCALLVLLIFASACETEDMMADDIAPEIEIIEPIDTVLTLSGESFSIFGRVTDNLSIKELTFKSTPLGLDGLILPDDFDEPTGGTFNVTIEIDELTPSGPYDIELSASDIAGNEASATIPIVVTE